MATFTVRCDGSGAGPRVAVKDLIDMAGFPTTAGCRAVADAAVPATADALCLAGTRAGARIVGRTNLHELALGVTGINPWFGTPVNPLDPARAPGGSSSGAAVAVMSDEADLSWGSDTGGSVRIPAACCGCAGLKTTWGRIPLDGVWPLAPSLDTVGPIAQDVAGLVAGMALLDPGSDWTPADARDLRVGRVSIDGCDPAIDAAIDRVLRDTEWVVSTLPLPMWAAATEACRRVLGREAWTANRSLVESRPEGIGADVRSRLREGGRSTDAELAVAQATAAAWRATLNLVFERFDVIVTPTLTILPPTLERAADLLNARCTLPVNLAGVPALALPVPVPGNHLPASIQVIGPAGSEVLLLGAAGVVESAR